MRKYDAAGTEVWTRQFGTSVSDRANGVSVDSSGVYVAGRTSGTFPGQTSAGNGDVFVAKILGTLVQVDIDIKPGSDPNCFNVNGNGVIPVAILGSANFDVTRVDDSPPVHNARGPMFAPGLSQRYGRSATLVVPLGLFVTPQVPPEWAPRVLSPSSPKWNNRGGNFKGGASGLPCV